MVLTIGNDIELINDLQDVSKVIRKYYNSNLADEMDRLIELNDENLNEVNEKSSYIQELEETIEEIKRLVW